MLLVCWIAAVVACLGYGVASVLQSVGANRPGVAARGAAGVGALAAILVQLPYLVGLALDGLAFVANVVALQLLPLYLVQAVVNASVGVTALVAWRRGQAIGRAQWVALAALGVGLSLLTVSAGSETATRVSELTQWMILGSGVVPLALAGVGLRLAGRARPTVLAVASGLAFTGVAIASRALVVPHPWYAAVGSPLLWTIVLHGALGMVVFALALQGGAVTAVSAITFVLELIVPTAVGLTLLGDSVPAALAPLAVLGFVLTLGATVALARFTEP